MVALKQRSLVSDFARHKSASDGEGEPGGIGKPKLRAAQRHVLRIHAHCYAIEKAAHGEIRHRHALFAQRLDGLRADLDVAHDVDLANFADADFLDYFLFILHLEDLAGFTHAEALAVEVKRAEIVTSRYETADWSGKALAGGRLTGWFVGVE